MMMLQRLLTCFCLLTVHCCVSSSPELSTEECLNKDKVENNSSSSSSFDISWRDVIFEQILAEDNEGLDRGVLEKSIALLKSRGAHRCWHKQSTFLEHLVGVHHILRLWGQGEAPARLGLFHSAYSNSYVNLALFDPNDMEERRLVRDLVGPAAEDLVYMYCSIDRQSIVVNTLLKNGYVPPEGITVPHLRKPDETVFLNAATLRMLVIFTMADISDQYFGWQDRLFGGDEMINSMLIPGMDNAASHESTAIWPGLSQPGLWMSYISQLGAVASTYKESDDGFAKHAELPLVFDNCTKVLSRDDEMKARDLYWSVITGQVREMDTVIDTLERCTKLNPWAFEPYVVLAQKYLHQNDFVNARRVGARALELQMQWGTAWDKRLSFPVWVAWTRVMYQRAQDEKDWPANSWDVNNFGLVRA